MPNKKPANKTPAVGPMAYTLSVIGSSWTCLILRDLLQHGARRFQDLQELAGWHCSNDTIGASQDARKEWRRGAAVLFDEFPAGRVRADREGSRPRPDYGRHAKLGTQVLELTTSPECPLILPLALFGTHARSDLSPECATKRTSADRSELTGSRPIVRRSFAFLFLWGKCKSCSAIRVPAS